MKTIVLTSKNQITIPVDVVRSLGLDKTRRVRLAKQGNSVVLTPEASLEDRLETHWAKMRKHLDRPLSDAEIREARHEAHAQRADRLNQRGKGN